MLISSSPEEYVDREEDRKRLLRKLFSDVMRRVNVSERMQECVTLDGGMLHLGPDCLRVRDFSRVQLVAIGKAAVPMAEHVLQVLRGVIEVQGVVVGVGRWDAPAGVQFFQGGHPVPDEHSFAAGRALLQAARLADERTLVLFLISGGASAMAEVPVDESLTYEEIAAFYRWLLHSGLPIQAMNTLRRHVSAIKGGRLALASQNATRATVLLSDVPPGMLDVVGSGPSLPDRSTVEDCRRLLAGTVSLTSLSPALITFFGRTPETPKMLPASWRPSTCFCALSSDFLIEAAKPLAAAAGYRVIVDNTCDDWEYSDAARYLVERAKQELAMGGPVCLISAGEVTVRISGKAGVGGRNQQWALEAARLIAGLPGFAALSAGSDGIDGNSPAAGAVVGSKTWSRAAHLSLDCEFALTHFATYPLFARLGDALLLGPSGNNLRDLRIVLAE